MDPCKKYALNQYRKLIAQVAGLQKELSYQKNPIKKIGMDLHGVLDKDSAFLCPLLRKVVEEGHEVHLMTGSVFSEEFKESILAKYDLREGDTYTHTFSITQHLMDTGIPVSWDARGYPFAEALNWDMAKGEYALLQGIDVLFDDSPTYCRYMPESCWYVTYSKETFNTYLEQVLYGTRIRIGR